MNSNIKNNALLRTLIREVILHESSLTYKLYEGALEEIAENYKDLVKKYIVDSPEIVNKMIATAIAISGRESTYGAALAFGGNRGPEHWGIFQDLSADFAKFARDNDLNKYINYIGSEVIGKDNLASKFDTTVGHTQVKLSNLESGDMKSLSSDLGVEGSSDLDYAKSIIITATMLHKLYKKAKDLGYSTTEPGVGGWNPEKNRPRIWTSTGDAALDLAITGYNAGEAHISNYCGPDPKEIKVKCPAGSKDIVKNYIPYIGSQELNTMFYVTAVAKSLPEILPVVLRYNIVSN